MNIKFKMMNLKMMRNKLINNFQIKRNILKQIKKS